MEETSVTNKGNQSNNQINDKSQDENNKNQTNIDTQPTPGGVRKSKKSKGKKKKKQAPKSSLTICTVHGLPWDINEEDLQSGNWYGQFGNITGILFGEQ